MSTPALSPVKQALLEIRRLRQRLDSMESARTEPIAIVGTGLRFPGGATDAVQFHEQLLAGLDAIVDVPADRWDSSRYFSNDRDAAGTMYTHQGGFLDDVAGFDPEFFGISPVEAATIDPQQRLLLEVCWEALEDAGIAATALRGSRTGVFLGIAAGDYGRMSLADVDTVDEYASLGTAFSVAGGRISYVLGVHGPAVSVDTACSASLVALHLACQSLRAGECDAALAAGVNLILSPEITINFCRAGMLAADGHCKTFDAGADGYVRSEGCATVVLKRLSDARRDGDRILCLVRGSAVNQDGRSSGLTAPNGPAQEAVIREALTNAGLAPRHIGYVEAHGTGTSLGDPIELQALGNVFGHDRPAGRPLLVGSVKTNVGHLEAAAGMAGLIKTIEVLRQGVIPPHRNFSTPNPHVAWSTLPLVVPVARTALEPIEGTRRAGLSSFGFSGTNVHIILEEPPAEVTASTVALERPWHILTLSAARPEALRDLAVRYAARLATATESFADIAHTASAGRAHFRHRLAVRAATTGEAAAAMQAWLAGDSHDAVNAGDALAAADGGAVLYPDEGTSADAAGSLADAAWTLMQTAPRFAQTLHRCDAAARPVLAVPLLEIVDPSSEHRALARSPEYAQPLAFAVQLALADVWNSLGIAPAIVVGAGVGEYVAAHRAGVFSLEDALRLVALRGRFLSGDAGARAATEAAVSAMTLSSPAGVRIVSARRGCVVDAPELGRAAYWLEAMQPTGDARTALPSAHAEGAVWVVHISATGDDPWRVLLTELARLYAAGVDFDWRGLDEGTARRRVSLPRYQFQRRRYWLSSREPAAPRAPAATSDRVRRVIAQRAELAPLDINIGTYPDKWRALEDLNRELGRNVLAGLGAFPEPGAHGSVDEVLNRCGIAGLYRPIVGRWLDALAGDGTLSSSGPSGDFTAASALVHVDLSASWNRVAGLLADNQPLLAYLQNCAALLEDVIAGRASALETLFPGGSFDLATALYERSAVMRYVNGIAAAAIEAHVGTAEAGAPVHILEFGGGTGGTTSSVLPVLPADRIQYDFTDVSDVFLEGAAERFQSFPFVRTGIFDLERDPAGQGYATGGYDVVLGANVLHAAKDLRAALARVESLLVPGGMLLLIESTGHLAWHDFSTGLIEGWQHFTDDLRTDTPLLPASRWVELLHEAGFEAATAAPSQDSAADVLKQHVIVAWRPAGASRAASPAARPASSMAAVVDRTKSIVTAASDSEFMLRLRQALPTERDELTAAAIRDCVIDVLHLDASRPPARDARLMDLGVDSLLAVRLRNVLQKRLGLPRKLPATLIFDHPTIARIATLIVDRHGRAEEPETTIDATAPTGGRAAEVAALTDAEAEALLLRHLETGDFA